MGERALEHSIAELLVGERSRRGLFLEQIAAYCCVSVQAVWKWEQRDTSPSSMWHMRRWAEAVGGNLIIKVVTKDGIEHEF